MHPPPIFFIHLLKAGGTSINHAAREYFPPERVLMSYGSESQWTSPAARKIMTEGAGGHEQRVAALSDYIVENDIAFFSSHLQPTGFACFDPARAFTILRHPVERVISEYFFFRRKGHTQESLAAHIERPDGWNRQARGLRGIDLQALGAVGVLDRYAEFIGVLNARFGWQFAVAHRKRGGPLKEAQAAMIGRSLRRRIETHNQEDLALYQQALEIMNAAEPANGRRQTR